MKHFLINLLFLSPLFSLSTKAQQSHYIYLQTENKQPFFVKLNDKVFSSASLGFLIIPKLQDGLYTLTIGYPQRTTQEVFNCSINNNDIGFIIKNTTENEWQLLNIQTQNLLNPGSVIAARITVDTLPKDTDAFSSMLANAVHDSSILIRDVVQETIQEKSNPEISKDSIVVTKKDIAVLKPVNKKIPKKMNASLQKAVAKKGVIKPKTNQPKVNSVVTAFNKDTLAKNGNTIAVVENKIEKVDTAKSGAVNDTAAVKTNILENDTFVKKDVRPMQPKDTLNNVFDNVLKDSLQNVSVNDNVSNAQNKKIKRKKKNIEQSDSTIVEKEKIKISEETYNKSNEIKTDTIQVATDSDLPKPEKQKLKKKKRNNEVKGSTIIQNNESNITDSSIITETKTNEQHQVLRDSNAVIPLSIIKRKFKKNTKEGLELMYIDKDGEAIDTIRILIPVNQIKKQEEMQDTLITMQAADTIENKLNLPQTQLSDENKPPVSNSAMINSDCKNFATDEDFLKVRKKMVAETTDEDMIKVAKKTFKSKCFTTEQIKNLSVLFLKDDGKYMFFDAAYPFVSDSEKYSNLENQLTDNYYITRFRAMIHK